MAQLPTGTVTFMFTDLEGSTRLWEERPAPMESGLVAHDALLRAAVESHGGVVVDHTGDGMCAVFVSASEAVAAGLQFQLSILTSEHTDVAGLVPRVALHAGDGVLRADGRYVNQPLNRCARLLGVGHGGQVLLSESVESLAADGLPPEAELMPLGEHRLRDVARPLRVFQLVHPGLRREFPPLKSLSVVPGNLPIPVSSFMGREHDVARTVDALRESRVVTLTGVGGVGKTRLALQVGSELVAHYADGVWLCELAQVVSPGDLPGAVAMSVGYTPSQGVPVSEGLPRFLERKNLLLVLDNCEHLVGAVSLFVSATTTHAAQVSILATSREALGVQGEHISPLSSLALPERPDVESVLTSEAGALFVARASEARGELVVDSPNARAVHDLCVRLDGIPLAIELAAAQTKVMSPGEVLARLDKQFRLVTGGRRTSLERHQTLRAAIDWSYELLADDERALLDRLSVCVAGFDLDAAVAIAAGVGVEEFDAIELLGSLVAKSLVERNEREGVTRYRLLEMIRQYTGERLNADNDAQAARDDHARHYLQLAVALFRDMSSAADYEALDRLESETANIAAAGQWLIANDRIADLMQFFDDVPFFDIYTAPVTILLELGSLAGEVVERPDAAASAGFPNASWIAAAAEFRDGDIAKFDRLAELATAVGAGDPPATTSMMKSIVATHTGDLEPAELWAQRAVERARYDGDPVQLAWMLAVFAMIEAMQGSDRALPIAEEALAVARRHDGTVIRLHPLRAVMSGAARSDPERALEAAEEIARIDHTRRRTPSRVAQYLVARIHMTRGEVAEGLSEWREILYSFDQDGLRGDLSLSLISLAGGVASMNPLMALEIAAIIESDAIAPLAAFATPDLAHLVDKLPNEAEAARARAQTMSYDDALETIFAAIDRLITECSPQMTAQGSTES